MIGMVGDQRGPKDGMRVKFFNRSTSVFPGTAAMAVKNGSPIFTLFLERIGNVKFRAHVEEIDTTDLPEDDDEKLFKINQQYMSILEKTIRKAPEQWLWMHKIWKH